MTVTATFAPIRPSVSAPRCSREDAAAFVARINAIAVDRAWRNAINTSWDRVGSYLMVATQEELSTSQAQDILGALRARSGNKVYLEVDVNRAAVCWSGHDEFANREWGDCVEDALIKAWAYLDALDAEAA